MSWGPRLLLRRQDRAAPDLPSAWDSNASIFAVATLSCVSESRPTLPSAGTSSSSMVADGSSEPEQSEELPHRSLLLVSETPHFHDDGDGFLYCILKRFGGVLMFSISGS